MGSRSSDFNLITDLESRKYRDSGSNLDGAVDDYITVKLGNGGSYQKKQIDAEKNTDVKNDLYAIPNSTDWNNSVTYNIGDCVRMFGEIPVFYTSKVDNNCNHIPPQSGEDQCWKTMDVSETYIDNLKKKYYRSKHFFIDPFELTIAQWCHIHKKLLKRQDRGDA